MAVGSHACDLDGCSNEAEPAIDEDDGPWTNPPEGWVNVHVMRRNAERVELEFCSEAHMAQRMQQHLSEAVRYADTGPLPAKILFWVAVLAVLAIFIVGLFSSLSLIADAIP